MVRRSRLSLRDANNGKLKKLLLIMDESRCVINLFIDVLWSKQDFYSKFVDFKVDTWLSARSQQCLGNQALNIVKSQRKCKCKTKPIFTGNSINLDSRFIDIQESDGHFDLWIRFGQGDSTFIKLPANKHKQYDKFKDWKRKGSIGLCCIDGKFYIDIFFEKEVPLKQSGVAKAVDIGYKKLIVSSSDERIGNTDIYEKIARKKQGSNAFKRALIERNELINVACKSLDLSNVKTLFAEDLKGVKQNSKGHIRKSFMNKLQRWSYPKVLDKLSMLCEAQGIEFLKVNPAYTSQRCSRCGVICKSNRQGEQYKCACGNILDADYNAALNILHLGIYGSHAAISGY